MPEEFWEDMGRKAEWFYETRGHQSNAELNARWRAALQQTEVLRQSRYVARDPGGGAIKEPFALVGKGLRGRIVDNPLPTATTGFASPCVAVTGARSDRDGALKLRPARGAATALDLRSAALFLFDDRLRSFELVEQSGYNAAGRYLWGLVHADGTYVAIALPKDPAAARGLALERFAYHYVQAGVEQGDFARAADYFDAKRFRRLAAREHEFATAHKADRAEVDALTAVHKETLSLRGVWRRQLPNGGLPEWHLIEHLATLRPKALDALGIGDLVNRFPIIFKLADRVGRWYPMGPSNVNGRVKSLAIHPSNGDIIYAGAANGGVWKTTSGGSTWESQWKFEDTMAVGSLAIARTAPETLYAATGEDTANYGPSYGGVGIYKTTDGGASWTQMSSAVELGDRCSRVLVHPSDADTVYLASTTGVHKSTDGGGSWTSVRGGHATDLVMAHDAPQTLYAGIRDDGVYKTTDAGATWTRNTSTVTENRIFGADKTYPFPTGGDAGWPKLAIGERGPSGSNFVIAKLGNNGATTLASNDGGQSWHKLTGSEGVEYDEWASFVAIHPRRHDDIYLGGLNLQRSTDGGSTFSATSGTHSDHHQIVFHPADNNHTCYVCCDGAVYRSDDLGATWILRSEYLQATQLVSLGVAREGAFVVGCATQDQGIIQTEGSAFWDDYGGGNEWGMFVVDPYDSNHMWVSPGSAQLRHSADRGHSWTNPTDGLTDYWASQKRQTVAAAFRDVAVRPGANNFLIGAATISDQVKDANGNVTDSYGPARWLMYSRDHGTQWWRSHALAADATHVAYAPSNGLRCYASSSDGKFWRNDHGGEPGWYEPAAVADRPPAGNITSITVDRSNADRVLITYGDHNPHVYKSVDGGAHWQSASGSGAATTLPDIAVSDLVIDEESRFILYAGTDIGVFRSNDNGATWYPYNDAVTAWYDLPKVVVTGLGVHPSTRRLFAATLGRGLYYTYTTGLRSLQVLAVSYLNRGRLQVGIVNLRLTDGANTYVMTRNDVIRRIEAGTNVYTVGADGTRAEVLWMLPDGRDHPMDYLMTTPDASTANNLTSLPRF